MSDRRFRDRAEAGELLGREMSNRLRGASDVVVLALPRGGVPVAEGVSAALGAPLDVFVVRKLGVPYHEELAMGAIASGGVTVMNDEVVAYTGVRRDAIDQVVAREQAEVERRERSYRGGSPPLDVAGRTVVIVDDGLATGSTMRAAVRALRKLDPRRIVVAVPVGASSSCLEVGREADEVVCLRTPEPFQAVGLWYEDFTQTTDEEVQRILTQSGPVARPRGGGGP